MEGDVLIIANVVIGALFVTSIGFVAAWMRARERAIRAELAHQRPVAEHDARLEQLQQTVDAIAVEVERISEAQRFTTKLLAEQHPDSVRLAAHPAPPQRMITPH